MARITEKQIREIVREEIEIILEQRALQQMNSAIETAKAIQKSQSHHVCENSRCTWNTKQQRLGEES